MDDSEKIKSLAEDYQKIQRIMEDLTDQRRKVEKSDEYLLGRKIFTSWWLSFIGSAYKLGRSIKSKFKGSNPQSDSSIFKNIIEYADTLSLYDYKIAVYTCIVGDYDQLQEPLFRPVNVDYILVTDGHFPSGGAWKGINVHTIKGITAADDSRLSRYVKLHPHLFLEGYDYSIYIDGNIKTMGDIRYLRQFLNQYGFASNIHRSRNCIYEELEACIHQKKNDPQTMRRQIDAYRRAGMPENYGLIEANMLLRDHKNPVCIEIMDRWWQQIVKHTTRDQLSLPFVLWEMGIPVSGIGCISSNVYEIPLIQIKRHLKS
jgi:hypothetical protein